MQQLRIGVVGCADIAWRAMIPAMLESPSVSLSAVASRSDKKARAFADRFNCDAVVGYDAILDREDIDAVYMPLPTALHLEWVTKALEAGKHILVEKSFAMDYESAQKMAELAKTKNLLVLENFMFPHHAQHAWVNDLIQRGELGEIHLLRSTFGFPPFQEKNIRYQFELGGGALLDAGAYVVKVAQLFLGDELELLGASLKHSDQHGVDFYGEAMFKNEMGQVAQVAFGFDYYYQCNYELLGTKGKLTVERAFTPGPGFRPTVHLEQQDLKKTFTLPADNHYVNILQHFTHIIQATEDFNVHLDTLLRQAKYLDAIRKASDS